MLHRRRRWAVRNVGSVSELSRYVTGRTQCLCAGFRLDGFLWLNDSTSVDALQEYALVRESDLTQVDSITVSWSTTATIAEIVKLNKDGAAVERWNYGKVAAEQIEPYTGHRCRHCT